MADREPTPEGLTQLAERHIRTLAPGHALIVRVPPDWPWTVVKDLHEALNVLAWEVSPGCKVIVVPALEVETREGRQANGNAKRSTARGNRTRSLTPARPPDRGA